MSKNLIQEAKKYIFAEKFQSWEEMASKASPEVLEATVNLMKMMEGEYNFKKIDAVMKKIPSGDREQVLRLLTYFAYRGPEYAFDKLYKEQHGKVDRNNEYVKGLLYQMDQNDILKGKERE